MISIVQISEEVNPNSKTFIGESHSKQTIPNLSGFDTISMGLFLTQDETVMNGNFLNASVVDGDKPYIHHIVIRVDGGFKVDISHGGVEGMDDGMANDHMSQSFQKEALHSALGFKIVKRNYWNPDMTRICYYRKG